MSRSLEDLRVLPAARWAAPRKAFLGERGRGAPNPQFEAHQLYLGKLRKPLPAELTGFSAEAGGFWATLLKWGISKCPAPFPQVGDISDCVSQLRSQGLGSLLCPLGPPPPGLFRFSAGDRRSESESESSSPRMADFCAVPPVP